MKPLPRPHDYTIFTLSQEWEKYGISFDNVWRYLIDGHLKAVIIAPDNSITQIEDFHNIKDATSGYYPNTPRFDLSECKLINGKRVIQAPERGPSFFFKVKQEEVKILLAEVERFEALYQLAPVNIGSPSPVQPGLEQPANGEHTPALAVPAPIPPTDEELCKKLKTEKRDDKYIAKELLRTFPKIFPSRISKLIKPDNNVQTDAHRKRGKKLLE